MKPVLTTLLIIITFISNAQDSINYSQLKFKSIKEKEFLLYPKWNNERPCAIPEGLIDLYVALDTNYHDGVWLTAEEKKLLHLDTLWSDTTEKYGKIEMGNYSAYILRYKYGNLPQYMWMLIYDKKGKEILNLDLAGFDYGESGSSCLMSFIKIDTKNQKIVILSARESEGWILMGDEVLEDGTIKEGDYCESYSHDLHVTSIDMRTMKVVEKEYSSYERSCE